MLRWLLQNFIILGFLLGSINVYGFGFEGDDPIPEIVVVAKRSSAPARISLYDAMAIRESFESSFGDYLQVAPPLQLDESQIRRSDDCVGLTAGEFADTLSGSEYSDRLNALYDMLGGDIQNTVSRFNSWVANQYERSGEDGRYINYVSRELQPYAQELLEGGGTYLLEQYGRYNDPNVTRSELPEHERRLLEAADQIMMSVPAGAVGNETQRQQLLAFGRLLNQILEDALEEACSNRAG